MFTSILQKELHFHTVHKKLYVRKILRLYMPEVAMRRSSVKLDAHWLLGYHGMTNVVFGYGTYFDAENEAMMLQVKVDKKL